jgi:hypothetical protein
LVIPFSFWVVSFFSPQHPISTQVCFQQLLSHKTSFAPNILCQFLFAVCRRCHVRLMEHSLVEA